MRSIISRMENPRIYGQLPAKVVLVHGGPGAAGEMAPVAKVLSRARGVLDPLQTAHTVASQVEELESQIEEYAAPPVVLVGYSWGAWLSCFLAARRPDLVRKLILISSGPFRDRYVNAIQTTRLSRLGDVVMHGRPGDLSISCSRLSPRPLSSEPMTYSCLRIS